MPSRGMPRPASRWGGPKGRPGPLAGGGGAVAACTPRPRRHPVPRHERGYRHEEVLRPVLAVPPVRRGRWPQPGQLVGLPVAGETESARRSEREPAEEQAENDARGTADHHVGMLRGPGAHGDRAIADLDDQRPVAGANLDRDSGRGWRLGRSLSAQCVTAFRKPHVVWIGSATVASGSRRVKHEPSPGVPRSSRVPPCWVAIQLAIARPSPVPVAAVALRPR
jgi:hypothetical protein